MVPQLWATAQILCGSRDTWDALHLLDASA